jgi:PAS domain S-box-containing protein
LSLYAGGLIVVAAVCVAVGLQHLLIATRVERRRVRLLFAVAAFAVAADAAVEIRLFRSQTPAEFQALMPWTAVWICIGLIALAWFIQSRTGATRRWLLVLETVLLTATALLDQLLPTGIAFLRVETLREVALPWGEVVRFAVGTPNPWRIVGDVANIGFMILLLDATVRLVRCGRRREAWLIGGSLFVLSLSVLVIIPTDLGIVDLPAIHPFGFLLVVAAMGWDLSDTVAREARLSREVVANERRWHQLLESVQLLVIGLDREGRITSMNPFAELVSGYRADEMVGRGYLEFVPEDERERIRTAVERGLRGDPESGNERVLMTRDGKQRIVQWRSVVLRDPDGGVEGLLSVGADVTERRRSEEEVRRTAADLERTVAELDGLRRRLEEENLYLKDEIQYVRGHEEIIGTSDGLRYVLHKVQRVAATDASVLLLGETGTGKELVARAIHRESGRSAEPFVAVNCAALPANLIESELFGHERGAFTGAHRRRRGRFELAHGGTLFLDEVGELPLELQPKLLRVLEIGEFERVGGSTTLSTDVRVISASNRDLRVEVEEGRFREDLYYRLEVYPITVPPLCERREDITLLVQHFAKLIARERGLKITEIPHEVLRHLEAYDWPGNIRELRNVIERGVLTSTDGVLRLVEPLKSVSPELAVKVGTGASQGRFATLEEAERAHVTTVLEACGGQIAGRGGAARVLGVHPNTLRSRLKKLGVTPPQRTRKPVA